MKTVFLYKSTTNEIFRLLLLQSGIENVENKNEDLDKSPKGQESSEVLKHVADGKTEEKDPKGRENKEVVADTSTQDDSKGTAKAAEKESSLQPKVINSPKGQTAVKKGRKGNFGGLKKGFLL